MELYLETYSHFSFMRYYIDFYGQLSFAGLYLSSYLTSVIRLGVEHCSSEESAPFEG